jgi:geranylgeranyl pyrophosphate synthase
LPGLCCQAAGGDAHWADELAVIWFLFYTAAHIFDQVEDLDPIDEVDPGDAFNALARVPGVRVNLATGMLFAASMKLSRMHQEERLKGVAAQIADDFYQSLLTMSNGQHLDLVTPQPTLEQWIQIASTKSGVFFRLACQVGATVATDQSAIVEAFSEYGFRLGLLLQILDDLGDFRWLTNSGESYLSPDAGRSLAVAYASEVLPADQRLALQEMLVFAPENIDITQQVIDLLNQCGAGLYLDIEIERQRELGIQALKATNPQSQAGEILLAMLTNLGKDAFPAQ